MTTIPRLTVLEEQSPHGRGRSRSQVERRFVREARQTEAQGVTDGAYFVLYTNSRSVLDGGRRTRLFVTQRVDWIEAGRAAGWINPEKQSDCHREA